MSGLVNTFYGSLSDNPAPCINDVTNTSSFSNCMLWLLVGLVIGSVAFGKKGSKSISA